jgi:crossover junction endodeoxyribonuclease RuvC
LGFDPGTHGAVALLRGDAVGLLDDLPVHTVTTSAKQKRDELDIHTLHVRLAGEGPIDHAYIERVSAHPGEGVTSSFRFGYSAGAIFGLLVSMGIPLTFIQPRAWQRFHHIDGSPDAARQRAAQLYPDSAPMLTRKKDCHRADALLIAAYGRSLEGI